MMARVVEPPQWPLSETWSAEQRQGLRELQEIFVKAAVKPIVESR
jgi:hypothetical protein